MCDYLESTVNCLYGEGCTCNPEDKVHYTRPQRKCKTTVMGITTFITIINVVVDWYNFSFYSNNTRNNIIYTEDIVSRALYWTFLGLCCISTLCLLCEFVAFVLQLKDSRIYESPVKRSELTEEIISGCFLLFENLGIPLIFLVGFFMGFCPISAQIRSFTGRIALVAAGVSAIWRMVQSLAYCSRCDQETITMSICQFLRAIRIFVIAASLSVIVFLLVISLSLQAGVKVDRYNGRYHGNQYSDIQESVYLYQRISAPYFTRDSDSRTVENCSYFETRTEIAKAKDLEFSHVEPYTTRIPCAAVSSFYPSFISQTHRSLLSTYQCYVIISIKDSDFSSSRIVNAVYELRDPSSTNCVSDVIDLVLDSKYKPAKHHHTEQTTNIWNSSTLKGLSGSVCDQLNSHSNICSYDVSWISDQSVPLFDCSTSECVKEANNSTDDVRTVGIVSSLLVSESELLSYYPCMPNVDVFHSMDIPVCDPASLTNVVTGSVTSLVSHTTCLKPFLPNKDKRDSWDANEQNVLQDIRMA